QNSRFDPDPFSEDTDLSPLNNNENIHTLFLSSPSLSKPLNFHVPVPDENKEEEDDDEDEGDEDDDDEDDDEDNDIDFFASPEIDSSDEVFVMESLNDSVETEIILWVFKFQQRFRLSDTALEALIKFLHTLLTHLNKSQFNNFPTSLYIAKKMLNIFQPKMQLAVCGGCHKLYNVKNIVEYKEEGKTAIANCVHEEFPNNSIRSRRNKCNNP